MIRSGELLERFEREDMQRFEPDFFRNLRIFEGLYQEAKKLGTIPPADPLEGIEKNIRLARVLNGRRTA
jgi:hypothetical protein